MEADGSGLIRLILKRADEGDTGRYKLKIFNTHGDAACEADLSYDSESTGVLASLITGLLRQRSEGI